jgi:hypothetical protein
MSEIRQIAIYGKEIYCVFFKNFKKNFAVPKNIRIFAPVTIVEIL